MNIRFVEMLFVLVLSSARGIKVEVLVASANLVSDWVKLSNVNTNTIRPSSAFYIAAMSSKYVCQRCLASLRRVNASNSPGIQQVSRRWHPSRLAAPASSYSSTRAQSTQSQSYRVIGPQYPPPESAPAQDAPQIILTPNNLFHPLSKSPIAEIRRRAAFIKQHAYCPHPSHRQTRAAIAPDDPEARKPKTGGLAPAHVKFECPDCGIPVSCCEEHWADDFETHIQICDILREINTDDHDLRSGRFFEEFEYPGPQMEEQQINLTNWDTFLYTREFNAINGQRQLRQATKLLTYPVTIGSVVHDLSPYNIRQGGRMTAEGLKSFSALRYSLHPPRTGAGKDVKGLRLEPPAMRVFVLGARAESSLPREVWVQLTHMFPRVAFHLIFIGSSLLSSLHLL